MVGLEAPSRGGTGGAGPEILDRRFSEASKDGEAADFDLRGDLCACFTESGVRVMAMLGKEGKGFTPSSSKVGMSMAATMLTRLGRLDWGDDLGEGMT